MNKRKGSVFTLVIITCVALAVFFNRQWLRDHYIVSTTDLSSKSIALAEDIDLTDDADFIYQASQASVDNAKDFNDSCRSVAREQSIVLGCYTKQRIYIYDVPDERLDGVKQVTAAHELLHAEYERMSSKERAEIDRELELTAANIDDIRFKATLAEYKRTEPDQINNELHSIIGTEITVIPDALEKHYQKYFKNRQKIVSYSKKYEATFTQLDDQIKSYDSQLADLKNQKDTLEATLATQQSQIESESSRMNSLRSQGSTNAYNAAVPRYNALVRIYNENITALRQIVAQYNELVEKRNKLATTQNDLSKQLDSNYQAIE